MAKWNNPGDSYQQHQIRQQAKSNPDGITNTQSGWELAKVIDVSMHHGEDALGENENQGLGWIKFRRPGTDDSLDTKSLPWAQPFSNTTPMPLKNEFVMVTSATTNYSGYKKAGPNRLTGWYYMGPLNYKGLINLNALDNISEQDLPPAPAEGADAYEQESNAAPDNAQSDTPIIVGKYGLAFTAASNIYPLQPLYGDNIIQGRWGQSIRFSCSQPNPEGVPDLDPTKGYLNNPWSDNENNVGEDPITIIRNGQSDESRDLDMSGNEALNPLFEDLISDKSSIWLTEGQTINSLQSMLTDTSEDGTGIATTKVLQASGLGNVYADSGKATPQVIIASDRLIFNAKDDEVLIFGKNGVGIAADNDIVLESNDTITISAPVIELVGEVKYGTGGKAIDGEKLIELLEDLIDEVMGLGVITATGPGAANPSPGLQAIKDKLDGALSSGDDQA